MSKHRTNSDFFDGFATESSIYENSSEEAFVPEISFDSMTSIPDTLMEVCNCQNVNVRAEASGSAKILSVVPKGFKCTLLEDTIGCDFYKVRDTKTGDVGFIKKEYMKRC